MYSVVLSTDCEIKRENSYSISQIVGAKSSLAGIEIVFTSCDIQLCKIITGCHRMVNELKERRFVCSFKTVIDSFRDIEDCLPRCHDVFRSITKPQSA